LIDKFDFSVVEDEPQSGSYFDELEKLFHNEQANQTPNEPRVRM